MTTDPLKTLLDKAQAVLFDFDGPICSVFDGYPAQQIADEMRELARRLRGESALTFEQTSSPHDLLLVQPVIPSWLSSSRRPYRMPSWQR